MTKYRTVLGALCLGLCMAAAAQTPGMGETRPAPPQRKAPPAPDTGKSETESGHELKRCDGYSGTMREDCLRELRAAEGAAAAGASRRPEPPTAPPPQNPAGR